MFTLTFYGGAQEVGGNRILLEDGETRLFFDFGTAFAQRYQFFEEYLKPRPGAGLLDLLVMKLLPPLHGLYREDLIPSPALWQRFASEPHYRELNEVTGVLVSHAHLDHSGGLSFLREDIPVHTSAMTAFIAKAMQDCGGSDFEREVCYTSPRASKEGYLSAAKGASYQQRRFCFLDGFPQSQESREFWTKSPAKKGLAGASWLECPQQIGSLPLRFFPVDHSILGARAFAVETSLGWVAYTGDLRLHGRRGVATRRFIEEIHGLHPYVLLCEGTRAGIARTDSEEEVYENARQIIRGTLGLVIADFGPRHVERLLTFWRIAQERERYMVLLPQDAYLLKAMHLASPEVPDVADMPEVLIFQKLKGQIRDWEKELLQGYSHRLVEAARIQAHPQDYLLCFSFWDINNLVDIAPSWGVYLYSTSEAHNEEQKVDLWRLRNWAQHFGLKFLGDPEGPGPSLHASGHASGPELLDLIRTIQPQVLVPIHTEKPEYFVEGLAGSGIEVRVPSRGGRMTFPAQKR